MIENPNTEQIFTRIERKRHIRMMTTFKAIHSFYIKHSRTPTIREIAKTLDCSLGTAFNNRKLLVDAGYIHLSPGKTVQREIVLYYNPD
tara:strand:+ start:137 stop:403 length:267 start_codon:yes stop_codon:yes gene_type:complete